jgi:hypothetical protein
MQEQDKCAVHECDLEPPDGVVPFGSPGAPPPVTRALLERGRDRFERFCAACHGIAGDGDSDVARAMTLRKPPSLVDANARALSDARILFVIERGYGLMPRHELSLVDRTAVLHFVRVLQGGP